jgi:hypothetical protein
MKDRMAPAMIEGADRDDCSPRATPSSSTWAEARPVAGSRLQGQGYRALIVMADCSTEEGFQLLRALGAEVDVVPSVEGRPRVTSRDIENMVARAGELARRPGHERRPGLRRGPPGSGQFAPERAWGPRFALFGGRDGLACLFSCSREKYCRNGGMTSADRLGRGT